MKLMILGFPVLGVVIPIPDLKLPQTLRHGPRLLRSDSHITGQYTLS